MVNGTIENGADGKGSFDSKGASNIRPQTAVLTLNLLKGYYYCYYYYYHHHHNHYILYAGYLYLKF